MADREVKYLPPFLVLALFITKIVLSLYTAVAKRNPDTLNATRYNVEGLSVNFSVLYFWIAICATLGVKIGVSQTEQSVPRILKRLQLELDDIRHIDSNICMPNECLNDSSSRKFHGGIYSWQPARPHSCDIIDSHAQSQHSEENQKLGLEQHNHAQNPIEHRRYTCGAMLLRLRSRVNPGFLAYVIVIMAALTSLTISSLVLHEGLNCRHIAELAIVFSWILSANLDILFIKLFPIDDIPRPLLRGLFTNHSILFWMTLAKDAIVTVATVAIITLAHLGILNRCACHTQWGQTGLVLPRIAILNTATQDSLISWFTAITFLRPGTHLCFALGHANRYYGFSLRSLIQRVHNNPETPRKLRPSFLDSGQFDAWRNLL